MSASSELCNLAEGVIRKVQELVKFIILKSFKEQFKHRKNISKPKKRYLMWIDLESCFASRVRRGTMVNLNIKDPVEFLPEPRSVLVKKELQKSLMKQWGRGHCDNHIQNNTLTKVEEFQERDSGWSLYEIIQLNINFKSYTPINVGI
nr:unnamed protein product [Callosobruchus analis]